MRLKYIFRNEPDDSDYLPGLYIKSKKNPDKASPEIEACMNEFQRRVGNKRGKCSCKCVFTNLIPMQSGLIRRLGKNEIHNIISSDKNCGLATM